MIARRVETHDDFFEGGPGVYMKTRLEERDETFDVYFVKPPCGHHFFLAHDPRQGPVHEVDEHDDGTISVVAKEGNSNSILCGCGWHGYIHHGEWRPL